MVAALVVVAGRGAVVSWVKGGGVGAAKFGPTTQPASNVAAASVRMGPAAQENEGERDRMDNDILLYYVV